jgi:hypothetical protein
VDERPGGEAPAPAELFDHRDRGHQIAARAPVGFVDGEAANAERRELREQFAWEAVLAVPLLALLRWHLGRDETPQRLAQQPDLLGLIREVARHARCARLARP